MVTTKPPLPVYFKFLFESTCVENNPMTTFYRHKKLLTVLPTYNVATDIGALPVLSIHDPVTACNNFVVIPW